MSLQICAMTNDKNKEQLKQDKINKIDCGFNILVIQILVTKYVDSDRDRMVIGFTNIYAISTYHLERCKIESHSGDTTLCDKVCQ